MIETHGSQMTSAMCARMGPQECEQIHLASLEILQRVGIEVHDETARELLVKGGCTALLALSRDGESVVRTTRRAAPWTARCQLSWSDWPIRPIPRLKMALIERLINSRRALNPAY